MAQPHTALVVALKNGGLIPIFNREMCPARVSEALRPVGQSSNCGKIVMNSLEAKGIAHPTDMTVAALNNEKNLPFFRNTLLSH